jgi:hypothetical protein
LTRRPSAGFDRVDTVVVEAVLLTTGHWAVKELVPFGDDDTTTLYAMALGLFMPEEPNRQRTRDCWRLRPSVPREAPEEVRRAVARGRSAGGRGLTLYEDGRAVAAVIVEPELRSWRLPPWISCRATLSSYARATSSLPTAG